jgi:hypothetical protein
LQLPEELRERPVEARLDVPVDVFAGLLDDSVALTAKARELQ